MDTIIQDVKFALRSYAKQPAFTAIALLTLALGIGVNTSIFTVVDAVVLERLPFPDAGRLVRVTADFSGLGTADVGMSAPELFDYRDRSGLFEDIAGLYPVNANLTQVDEPERVEVMLASPGYFSLLGVRPALGRVFNADDNHPGIAEVAVISDALWKRRFGGAPDVLGRTLRIDDDSYTIVGVMPPEFRHPGRSLRTDVELWSPAGYRSDPFPSPPVRGAYMLSGAIARLKPGISVAEAERRLEAFGSALRQEFPKDYPDRAAWTPRLVPLQQDVAGNVRPALLMLLGAVGLVLAIACTNVAGLLLARTSSRQRELAVRRALGSGRARLVRLLITESVLLSVAGGVVGLVLAAWSLNVLLALVPSGLPRLSEVRVNGTVLGFAFLLSVATGILFGLAPALQFSNPDLLESLKDSRSPAAPSRRLLRAALVAGEFALALVLLVAAALLARSFWRLQQVDPGFDGRNVMTARIWLPRPNDPARGKYLSHPPRLALFDDILRRVAELPNVESAGIVSNLPLDGQRGATPITVDGRDSEVSGQLPTVQGNFASADYFRTLRIPIVAGRGFAPSDDARAARVAVVNRELVRRYFDGVNPIGQRIHYGAPASQAPWMTIVGVAGNALNERLEADARPMVYAPMTQVSNLSLALVVRTTGNPEALATPISRAVRAADADVPVFAVRTMEEIVSSASASRRFSMQLLLAFAILALMLAAIGIYGVMAFLVSQRTREIGIRMALGARQLEVVRMVIVHALGMVAAGLGVGLVAAVMLTRAISGMLFRVSPTDPLTFTVIVAVLAASAIAATLRPALRAARVDPMAALRAE